MYIAHTDIGRAPTSLDQALDALWSAVGQEHVTPVGQGEMRRLARRVSREARGASLLPEHLVVAVKQSWADHPELRGDQTRHDSDRVLARVVGMCIDQFFAPLDREQQIRLERE